MPVTLAEASRGTVPDLDARVIDEFRKISPFLDLLTFDDVVNPAGGGATWSYQYRRLVTQRSASFRQINSEYTPQEVETAVFTSTLAPLGGSFEIDRVLAEVGPTFANEVTLQMGQLIKSAGAFFSDQVINGDVAVTSYGFDGLNKALAGSDTEFNVGETADWSNLGSDAQASLNILDDLDEFLQILNGPPTAIIGNRYALSRVRAVARRVGLYVRNPIEGLLGPNGAPVEREMYGNIMFIDAGEKAGSSQLVIPNYTRDVNGASFTVGFTGAPAGGTFTLTAVVNGVSATTGNIAYNASAATVEAALVALANIGENDVEVGGTAGAWTVAFVEALRYAVVTLQGNAGGLTGGTSPTVAVASVGSNTAVTGLTDLYAVRMGLDGFHGISFAGRQIVKTWLPDFTTAGAVKTGEAELGPIGVALKATKAAAVFRNIKVVG